MRLLDTSIVIEYLQKKQLIDGDISVITLMELLRGIPEEKREQMKKSLEELHLVQGIDNETILQYCILYDTLKKQGEMIPEADLIIAATAISKKNQLVTRDNHFDRLIKHGLNIA